MYLIVMLLKYMYNKHYIFLCVKESRQEESSWFQCVCVYVRKEKGIKPQNNIKQSSELT